MTHNDRVGGGGLARDDYDKGGVGKENTLTLKKNQDEPP